MLTLSCVQCGRESRVAEYLAGLPLLCTSCGNPLKAQAGSVSPSAPPPRLPPPPVPRIEENPSNTTIRSAPVAKPTFPSQPSPLPPPPPPAKEMQEPQILATRWQRLLARIIDAACIMSILPIVILILYVGGPVVPRTVGGYTYGVALSLLLLVRMYLLATRGQDYGKAIVGIRVVKSDGSPAGYRDAVGVRDVLNGFICSIPIFGAIYLIVDIAYIFSPTQECLHDRLAGTIVVKSRSA